MFYFSACFLSFINNFVVINMCYCLFVVFHVLFVIKVCYVFLFIVYMFYCFHIFMFYIVFLFLNFYFLYKPVNVSNLCLRSVAKTYLCPTLGIQILLRGRAVAAAC